MTKKEYLKPVMTVTEIDLHVQILADSVQTTGLDGEDLTEDETSGNTWDDAMSRRRNRKTGKLSFSLSRLRRPTVLPQAFSICAGRLTHLCLELGQFC